MAHLSAEEIEQLNTYGPYNHAVWQGRGITITHEESLSGRARFLANLVRKVLTESYTTQQMAEMSIVDVGCYDGWLLDQLIDLPFKRVVGIEPRMRNIEKGNKAREILHIKSRTEFRVGSIESLGNEVFDIVICTGLMHHLETVGDGLRALKAICRKKLFLETQCLSSHHITPDFVRELEPKDIVYFGKTPLVGLSGHKFESSYYHGSAMKAGIVSLPTVPTLQMFLQNIGFKNIQVLVQPSTYWSGVVQRPAKACCVVADQGLEEVEVTQNNQIFEYESAMQTALLPVELSRGLYNRFCTKSPEKRKYAANEWLVGKYITTTDWLSRRLLNRIRKKITDRYAFEIIKNLRYAPTEKITLEAAKHYFAEGNMQACISTAKQITTYLNADWRATYRAFLLLARAHEKLGDQEKAKHYLKLCLISNPELPKELLEKFLPGVKA